MIKTAKTSGADERTPSIPQYFSWINNTNEGSTEKQTLVNLDFFRYMKETYGMQIRIYAWDAGNFDGAASGYGDTNSEKFRSQYPEGYKNVVAAAEKIGIRMGLWGGPDGFGDDPETEKDRFDFYVHLCRDYHFAEFKIDGVCGQLRPEKAGVYADMLKECRKYSPDLIVLNHRLELYEAAPYATTYLWNGVETYIDVLVCNPVTAMHNRAYMFFRGNTPDLDRLTEDHGVCISSSPDYFEDDLVYQAFGRSLILAPELYGNPWFIRDNELPKLARIYNLHKHNAQILVDGMELPEKFGPGAVSRGTSCKRYICTGNPTWELRGLEFRIDESIGITEQGTYCVNIRHPYEENVGQFRYGDTVILPLLPFRAALIEVSKPGYADPVLTNCRYEVIKEDETGAPAEVKYLASDGGHIGMLRNGEYIPFGALRRMDIQEKPPVFLGSLNDVVIDPEDGEAVYEAAVFPVNNDSLEARAVLRSGKSNIPEVNAAREAFFGQKHYKLRGCEARAMFDGDPDTFFDGQSLVYQYNNLRIDGGCLRVDCGKILDADTVEIEFFAVNKETPEIKSALIPEAIDCSADFTGWRNVKRSSLDTAVDSKTVEIIVQGKHTTYPAEGKVLRAVFPVNAKMRYFRLPCPPERIYAVRVKKDGRAYDLKDARGNNMQAPYSKKRAAVMKTGSMIIPEHKPGSYLAVAIEGVHGAEGVYCASEIDGENVGFPRRAPDYKANVWEHRVMSSDKNNTFFMTLPEGSEGRTVTIKALFADKNCADITCNVWLCEEHNQQ